jgi:hypothetical protein
MRRLVPLVGIACTLVACLPDGREGALVLAGALEARTARSARWSAGACCASPSTKAPRSPPASCWSSSSPT